MKRVYWVVGGVVGMGLSAMAWAQDAAPATQPSAPAAAAAGMDDATDIAPGFKLASNGIIGVNDVIIEVQHFDDNWGETAQHDAMKAGDAPTTVPSSHIVKGVFTANPGPFNLTEQIDTTDGGIKYTVNVDSTKELATNELSVGLTLPIASFSGKSIKVDDQDVSLPAAAAAAGQASLLDQDGVHQIDIPMANGTLTISGTMSLHLQDDREWNGQQYSLRLHFTPSSGQLKNSTISLDFKWKPKTV